MKRMIKFYVLWTNKTWTVEQLKVEGRDAIYDIFDSHYHLEQIAIRKFRVMDGFEAVGPVYHIGDLEN